ncbi:hypothetical protein SADUNF_Sadunf11G0119200 [Salix dunnii]|uniref:Uncharacterized protein n=1 Tax=Salix dunnii TaxID=1413687 RepID=A0A835JLF2_9ROSI|nr:hypothetical protein SADUNF_Sadunf11G0119200 [Salix dunnii]
MPDSLSSSADIVQQLTRSLIAEPRFIMHAYLNKNLQSTANNTPKESKWLKHMLFVVSVVAIACTLAPAFDPSPLQDFCVADPTIPGQVIGRDCLGSKMDTKKTKLK